MIERQSIRAETKTCSGGSKNNDQKLGMKQKTIHQPISASNVASAQAVGSADRSLNIRLIPNLELLVIPHSALLRFNLDHVAFLLGFAANLRRRDPGGCELDLHLLAALGETA